MSNNRRGLTGSEKLGILVVFALLVLGLMSGTNSNTNVFTTTKNSDDIVGTWINNFDNNVSFYTQMRDDNTYSLGVIFQNRHRAFKSQLDSGMWYNHGNNTYKLVDYASGTVLNVSCNPSTDKFVFNETLFPASLHKANDSELKQIENKISLGIWHAKITNEAPVKIDNTSILSWLSPTQSYPSSLYVSPNAHNVSYQEVIDFIKNDKTDKIPYNLSNSNRYVCLNYALDVQKNASYNNIIAGIVTIEFSDGTGHAINVFNTTDRGLIYIDCTSDDKLVEPLKIGTNYTFTPISDNQTGEWDEIIEIFDWWPYQVKN